MHALSMRGGAAGLRLRPLRPAPFRSAASARAALSAGARAAPPAPAAGAPPSHPAAPVQRQLGWAAAHRAATIAAWSGLCYLNDRDDLEARLAARGMTLVASGRTDFTSWFVADGSIDAAAFARRTLERRGGALAGPPGSPGGRGDSPPGGAAASLSSVDAAAAAAAAAALAASAPPPSPRRERFVLLRGVQWGAYDLDSARMWRSLVRVWPRPLATAPEIVAHDGVADMATAMFDQLRPYLDQAEDAGIPVVFGGHSLGGALSKLLMVLYRASTRRRDSQPPPSCYTFGSPPVMAHAEGGGGDRVLQLLGLERGRCSNFVLQNDPIPRALLSVDPTYQMLSGLPVVQRLLELRAWAAGHGGAPLSPQRFLFETVGDVHFIKWTPQDGTQVLLLEPDELASELSMLSTPPTPPPTSGTATPATPPPSPADAGAPAAGGAGGVSAVAAAAAARLSPMATVQAVLDHHHGSYAQELEAAAGRELSRILKGEQQQQQQQQQQQAAGRAPGAPIVSAR